MGNVLVIDSDRDTCGAFVAELEAMGHRIDTAPTLSSGLTHLEKECCSLVFVCSRLPDGDGVAAIPAIRLTPSSPEVVIITNRNDPESAEMAIRTGAYTYLRKPVASDRLKLLIKRVMELREEKRQVSRPVALKRCGIIGDCPALRASLDMVAQAAATEASVLICGETGTGKELFANAIHKNSPRKTNPFVVVDCAALPETLVESILFGHEKGAFTSADAPATGLVTQANQGTLFLDEVGELPLSAQKPFLRVLEGHTYRPVGGTRELSSDFRLVAATNRDLEAMVGGGEFRKDLLYRIQGVNIDLPPLRTCTRDLNELACHFIGRICKRLDIPRKGFSTDFLEHLEVYSWPGNVRELIHTLESAISAAGEGPALFPRHLPTRIRAHVARATAMNNSAGAEQKVKTVDSRGPGELSRESFPTLKDFRSRILNEVESSYLKDLIQVADGDIPTACQISGLSRPRLYALLKQYGVDRHSRGQGY